MLKTEAHPGPATTIQIAPSASFDLRESLRTLSEIHTSQGLWLSWMAANLLKDLPKEFVLMVRGDELQQLVSQLDQFGQQVRKEVEKGFIRTFFTRGDPEAAVLGQVAELAKQLSARINGATFPHIETLAA